MTLPQTSIPPAANVLATIGTVLWCIQLVPQAWHNWRRKKTEGLPGLMVLLWAICSVPFGVYTIVQQFAVAIQIQPQVFGVLALVNWGQTLYYNDGWCQRSAISIVLFCIVLFGALEVLLTLTLKIPYGYGVSWPIEMIGIIASILLAAGLIPPYWEIWKRRGQVVGINWMFLSIDWLGALFSLLAVVEQQTFDALGGSLYILVMVFEAGIFLSQGIWLLRRHISGASQPHRVCMDEEAQDITQEQNADGPVPATPRANSAAPAEGAAPTEAETSEKLAQAARSNAGCSIDEPKPDADRST